MRVHFVSHSVSRALPPSEAVAIWTKQVAERLADDNEVVVWGRRYPDEPPVVRERGVEYRLVVGRGDYRLHQGLERLSWMKRAKRPIHLSLLYHPAYHLAVAHGLRLSSPDVVHIHSYPQVLWPARRACPRALLVFHAHSQYFTYLDRRVVGRYLEHADLIVCCSEFVSAMGREAFPEHAPRFATVYNGVDVDRFGQASGTADGKRVSVLFAGRISPEKGVHVLTDAFAEVADRNAAIELVVIGKEGIPPRETLIDIDPDPRVQALRALWKPGYRDGCLDRIPPDVRPRAHFEEWVEHARLAERFASADIFVWPAVWEEPFGMPVVEAMAAGLPVVASRVGGLPEIVEHGKTGILVDPARPDALAAALGRLAADPELRVGMGNAGRRRAQDFAWERIAERTAELYNSRTRGDADLSGRRKT